ncbi:sulfurtransferase [Sulfurifustis variabilis]|uniref:TVP38/TMEM64 family membrane protein n=2 Tax=Sulfurifustis variabilis TaxID=1675686 RepID=A0A1B4V6V9_9GAMM|nr:sulfurtransferase [Sulfurifustis variabilis]
MSSPRPAQIARLALFGLLVLAVVVAFAYRDRIDVAALQLWLEGQGAAAPFAFVAFYVLATVLFLPGSVLTLAGGALFGPVAGTAYSLIGATIGATAAFLIARHVAGDWVARKAGGRLKTLIDGVEAEGWRFVAFVRLVPLFPFNLLNYALGLTRIPLAHYVVASLVCMFPGALAYTYLGYAGRAAAEGSENMIRIILLALALLAVALFLPKLIKRWRQGAATGVAGLKSSELKARLDRGEDIAVLDVRPAKDYAGELGHIPGSINIPLDELPKRLPEIEDRRERPLAVICRTNRQSGKAVGMLRDLGFKQALLVEDGMVGWTGKAGAPAQSGACGAAAPAQPSAGTGKTVTLIIQNAPYRGDNKAWHALRFAGAALAGDMKVRVHLLDDGAQLARKGHVVPEGAADLEKLLTQLMEFGLEVRACGMALNDCKLDERDLIPGVQSGSMTALAGWVKESDLVLTF